jgi:hypothetical protein
VDPFGLHPPLCEFKKKIEEEDNIKIDLRETHLQTIHIIAYFE